MLFTWKKLATLLAVEEEKRKLSLFLNKLYREQSKAEKPFVFECFIPSRRVNKYWLWLLLYLTYHIVSLRWRVSTVLYTRGVYF